MSPVREKVAGVLKNKRNDGCRLVWGYASVLAYMQYLLQYIHHVSGQGKDLQCDYQGYLRSSR